MTLKNLHRLSYAFEVLEALNNTLKGIEVPRVTLQCDEFCYGTVDDLVFVSTNISNECKASNRLLERVYTRISYGPLPSLENLKQGSTVYIFTNCYSGSPQPFLQFKWFKGSVTTAEAVTAESGVPHVEVKLVVDGEEGVNSYYFLNQLEDKSIFLSTNGKGTPDLVGWSLQKQDVDVIYKLWLPQGLFVD
jgi:hypothetical protein